MTGFGMMTTQLPEDLERFVREAVRTGRYTHEDDVIRNALTRLRRTLSPRSKTLGVPDRRVRLLTMSRRGRSAKLPRVVPAS